MVSLVEKKMGSGISDQDIANQKFLENLQEGNLKFYRGLAGAIPEVGAYISEYLVDPLFSQKPPYLSLRVDRDLQGILAQYEKGDLNKQQLTQRVVNTLLDERIPTDLRMRYLPPCLDAVGDFLAHHDEALQSMGSQLDFIEEQTLSSIHVIHKELELGLEKIEDLRNEFGDLSEGINLDKQALATRLENFRAEIRLVFDQIETVMESESETKTHLEVIRDHVTATSAQVQQMNEQLIKQWALEEEMRELQDFDRHFKRLEQNVANAVTLFSLFGDREVAQRVGAVAQAGLTLGREVAGLMGKGSLALSTGPLGAALAIGACIARVVDAFGSPGPSGTEVIIEQLMVLSRQVAELQKQMHQRFDILEDKVDEILDTARAGLKTLEENQSYGLIQVEAIQKQLAVMDNRSRVDMEEIKCQIEKVAQLIKGEQRGAACSKLTNELFKLLYDRAPDPLQYRKKIGKLETFAFHTAIEATFYEQAIPVSTVPVDFDYAIQTFANEMGVESDKRIPNPTVFSMAAMGILYLTLRQYPDPADPDPLSRISIVDLQRLGDLKGEAKALLDHMRQLSTGEAYDLRKSVYGAWEKLAAKLKEILSQHQEEYQIQCNQAARVHHHSAYASSELREAFQKDLPLTLHPAGSNWFSGEYWTELLKEGQPKGKKKWLPRPGFEAAMTFLLSDKPLESRILDSEYRCITKSFEEPTMLRVIIDTIDRLQERYAPHAVDFNRWNGSVKTVEFKDDVLKATFGALFSVLSVAGLQNEVPSEIIKEAFREMGEQVCGSAQSLSQEERQYAKNLIQSLMQPQQVLLTDR